MYPKAHIIQSSTLDSVTAETYLLESKFSSEREKRPFGCHSLSRLYEVLKRMQNGGWRRVEGGAEKVAYVCLHVCSALS